jgi:hypothetical protein
VQQASGGIKFGSNIQMKVEAVTQTAEDATGMVNGLKFLLGMLAMNQNNPGQHQEALALLQNLSLTSQGNTVQMSLTIPEDQLEQVIRDSKSAHAKTSPAKDSPASLEPRIIQ